MVETLLGSGLSVAAEGEEHLDTFATSGAALADFWQLLPTGRLARAIT